MRGESADETKGGVPEQPGTGVGASEGTPVAADAADEELSPWYGDLAETYTPDDLTPDVPDADAGRRDTGEAARIRKPHPLDDEGLPAWHEERVPAPFFKNVKRLRRGKRLVKPEQQRTQPFEPETRVLILDTWIRSGLPAGDFAPLVGISKHTLYAWKKRFEDEGPAGLVDKPKGARKGSRLAEATKRSILMIKEANPDFGVQRISDMLLRGPALSASPSAVSRVLHEAGYVTEEVRTSPHRDKPRRFERANPNELWQTDIFTFTLKRTNRRVHLVAFMDDHSRFITSFALNASASTAMVIEAFERGIVSYRPPTEVLTDNGPQYVTWRGTSQFAKECRRRGIKQIVSKPKHPQTLGKIERFWGTIWRDCIRDAIFVDINDAERRIGLFIDYHNFQRPHQGIGGLTPADRFFEAQREVLHTLRERVHANSLEIARNGSPKAPFYITGNVNGKAFSVHAEGERILLRREGEDEAQEIDLTAGIPVLPEAELVEVDQVEQAQEHGDTTDDEAEAEDQEAPSSDASSSTDEARETNEGEDEQLTPIVSDRVKEIVANLKRDD
jgi:transposase InsO family protein